MTRMARMKAASVTDPVNPRLQRLRVSMPFGGTLIEGNSTVG
jgi:hypothetical protein